MTINSILEEMGPNVDLIACSNDWLTSHSQLLTSKLDRLNEELRAVYLAQQAKNKLQQQNLVAIMEDHCKNDAAIIRIISLPDALRRQRKKPTLSGDKQKQVWEADGYDLHTSEQLRSA